MDSAPDLYLPIESGLYRESEARKVQTQLQLQRAARQAYGVQFSPSREIIKAVVTDGDSCMIVTVKSRVDLRSREDRVTHHGMRTIKLQRNEGVWVVESDDTIWLELPAPIIFAHWAVKNTPERVAADRLAWNLCERPGAASWVGGSAWRTSDMDSQGRRMQLMAGGL